MKALTLSTMREMALSHPYCSWNSKYISNSAHSSQSLVNTLPFNNHWTTICNRSNLWPFLHAAGERSLLCNGQLLALPSRFCRLVGIFFATRVCRCKKHIHTAVGMWVLNFTINPFFFPVIAFAPSLHSTTHFFPVDATVACSHKKQIKEALSCCTTRYWHAKKHILLNESTWYLKKHENCVRFKMCVDFSHWNVIKSLSLVLCINCSWMSSAISPILLDSMLLDNRIAFNFLHFQTLLQLSPHLLLQAVLYFLQ
jgi:hypothetical protein